MKLLSENNCLHSLRLYNRALTYSHLFISIPNGTRNNCLLRDMAKLKTPIPFVCHLDTTTDTKYFGLPVYFFRTNYTSAVNNIAMLRVKWVPFQTETETKTATIGRISIDNWNSTTWSTKRDPFLCFHEIQSSRYALSYIPYNATLDEYVSCSYVALDAETLEPESNHVEFGDNMFPYFKGKNNDLQDEDSSEDENQIQNDAPTKTMLPVSVLTYLRTVLT